MTQPFKPTVPDATPIAAVLRGSPALVRLGERLRDSQARFDAIRAALPGPMAQHVKPGPVDDEGWSLLAANPAVAAKLRQLAPRLQAILAARGWGSAPIRIKILQG